MTIVLDTNILLVSIPINSPYRIIFDKFLEKKYTLVISNDILAEYNEVIANKTNSIVATNIIEMLMVSNNVIKQDVFYNWQLIEKDKDDNKFVDCSIACNADYLVSNDNHFNILKTFEFPKVNVIDIHTFIKLLLLKNEPENEK